MSQTPTNKGRLREPPPSLFLGPPSQNASNISLAGPSQMGSNLAQTTSAMTASSTGSRIPLTRQRSNRHVPRVTGDSFGDATNISTIPRPLPRIESESQKQADKTDALWAQMQSTLEEVELNAVSGMQVFGPEHTKALDSLRSAQIALAQAWVRSGADDAVETIDRSATGLRGSLLPGEGRDDTEGRSARNSASGVSGSIPMDGNLDRLDEETDADTRVARRRREANDEYFQRVNGGVLDVVAKLQDVADAMKAVEKESRDIWEDSEASLSTESIPQ
ncbi:hypothetical protein V502_05433 [Pseudogymnoascus sp. VKM F-4520 (FW-2644)]|nr:hypothetical protein V502_05433 [Pseudogymnoascus sp. VKM F-4520 (FW-2644)]